MRITITDDFSLKKIIDSGQCFRAKEIEKDYFRFIHKENVLLIRQISSEVYEIDTDQQTWDTVWQLYFDLSRNYTAIRQSIDSSDVFMKKASEEGKGIRILKQDPWEMLISFIISQRKSIPAIRQSIQLICERWGAPIHSTQETVFAFPTAAQLADATDEELRECKVGYRAPYILHAIETVLNHNVNLEELYSLKYSDLMDSLMLLKGVGIKVANCIALFAYGQVAAAPVDTWIQKIIAVEYGGADPFPGYGDVAGIMQQYAFFYAQNHKEEF